MNAKAKIVRKTDKKYAYRLVEDGSEIVLHEVEYNPLRIASVDVALRKMREFIEQAQQEGDGNGNRSVE